VSAAAVTLQGRFPTGSLVPLDQFFHGSASSQLISTLIMAALEREIGREMDAVPPYIPGGGEVVELAVRGEDDDADVGVAEDGELPGLLEQPGAALAEGHLPVHRVLDAPQLHLAPRHGRPT